MTTLHRLIDFFRQSPLICIYGLFLILPVFIIQLCLYLNLNDRPAEPLFFLQVALSVFFISATVFYILFRVFCLISKKISSYLFQIIDIFFVALFILAMFFPVQHALLDGREYPPVPLLETLKQILIPVIVLALLFIMAKKKSHEFKIVQMTLFVASMIFITYSAISMHLVYRNNLKPAENTEEAFCELGKRNVILFIVETFQGSYLEELAAEVPELFTSFSGVTLFPRAITSVGWSPFSTVQLFSGSNDWSKHDTRASAINTLNDDSLITSARDKGYRFSGGGYTPVPGSKYASTLNADIPLKVRLPQIILTHSKYYFASLRRMLPAFAWNRLQMLENKVYSRYLLAGQYPGKIAARNNFVGLMNCLRTGDTNAFLYFFNYMTHVEILFDSQGHAIPGLPQNKKTQLGEYTYALTLYAAFLDRLKNLGVYDDSLIIITGDHGAYNEPRRYHNPAVLIKPPRAEGKLSISLANLLLTDIRALVEAYMRSDDACQAEFLHLARETGSRKMRVYTHTGGNPDSGQSYQSNDIFGDIETVIQTLSKK